MARERDRSRKQEIRLDRLIGRMVTGPNGERIGRLEEGRAEHEGGDFVITSYVLGRAGLLERLDLGLRLISGARRRSGYIARWDQIDISDAIHPRLTCPVKDLVTPLT